MGNKSHFFRQKGGLKLLADYQFNNNLIDDANGYNLTGSNITYDNGSAVFNGSNSEARRTDANDIFSFTDGVNDLPFRIEFFVKIGKLNGNNWLVSKRDGDSQKREWQINYTGSQNTMKIFLYDSSGNYMQKGYVQPLLADSFNNVVIEYDGSKTIDGLNIFVNGVVGTLNQSTGNYTGMIKTQSDLLIGRAGWDGSPSLRFSGEIDYLKIYK